MHFPIAVYREKIKRSVAAPVECRLGSIEGSSPMIALLTDPNAWGAFATLSALEVVLGIDNIVFISILVSRCTPDQALRARQIGLSLAFVFRVAMLLGLT